MLGVILLTTICLRVVTEVNDDYFWIILVTMDYIKI